MADEKVRVRIRPLKGIGGVGNAGDVVMMSPEDAEMYFRDGYVEYVDEEQSATSPQTGEASNLGGDEDHAIMKPEARRGGRVVRKK